jgi:hypothetical protein
VIVKEHPTQNLAAFSGRLAAQLARLGTDVILNDARLGQDQIAVLQHRHFTHDIQLAKRLGSGLAVEEINVNRLPRLIGQRQRKCGLIGISAFAKAMQLHGHVGHPPR